MKNRLSTLMPVSYTHLDVYKRQEQYSVGIYARLSRDDERAGESVSIENQKEMLARYVREQGWTLYDYYLSLIHICKCICM